MIEFTPKNEDIMQSQNEIVEYILLNIIPETKKYSELIEQEIKMPERQGASRRMVEFTSKSDNPYLTGLRATLGMYNSQYIALLWVLNMKHDEFHQKYLSK